RPRGMLGVPARVTPTCLPSPSAQEAAPAVAATRTAPVDRPRPAVRRPGRRGTDAALIAPPVLVRQVRNGIVESEHRGHVVERDQTGRIIRLVGDPDHLVTLRSTVKPFGLVSLIEAGGIDELDLTPAELAIMASSHSGEDLHVRTIQG